MYVISLLAQKGGSGKTTLAECLAVAATQDGKLAAILDMDPQGTARSWKQRRGTDDPAVISVTMANLDEELARARDAGADMVFIDTPARLSDWAMEAARVSDLVIVPSRATVKDLERVEASIKLATVYAIRPVFVVLTQVRPRGDRHVQAEQFITAKRFPVCPAQIGDRVSYQDSDVAGLTPLETEPAGKGADEIRRVYRFTRELLNQLQTKKANHEQTEEKSDRRAG
ncbi:MULTISPECIES: ParA family protein [Paracoccus]|uniref:ParA family protein n=1 Tax=Paracoccus TaxID=265 RepID=UPI001FB79157|nr:MULTISPECIES: ParA family protein [Paracoccus]MCJ1901238.1 ParA family protein [Paracoccus versutus]MDF3905874.1 ParA family protein [Paracoccus sp. AS002]